MAALQPLGWTNANGEPDFSFKELPAKIHPWWRDWLTAAFLSPELESISAAIAKAHEELEDVRGVYPPKSLVFKAFEYGPPKVVILGQDPYPSPGNAMGLAFSVPPDQPRPQSLLVMYKELAAVPNDPKTFPKHGDLTSWADQGVMLLNTSLTVRRIAPCVRLDQVHESGHRANQQRVRTGRRLHAMGQVCTVVCADDNASWAPHPQGRPSVTAQHSKPLCRL